MINHRKPRSGAVTVESAFVYPLLFLIILAIVLLGLTVFRYQQVAHIAREASRYASIHGDQYQKESGTPAATQDSIFNEVVVPQSGLPASELTCAVTWNTSNKVNRTVVVIDPVTGQSKVVTRANTVSVTVTYSWNTGLFGTIPVSSTSVNTMSY